MEIQASSKWLTMATAQRRAQRSVDIRRSFLVMAPPNFYNFFFNSEIREKLLRLENASLHYCTCPYVSVAQALSRSEKTGPGHSIVTDIP